MGTSKLTYVYQPNRLTEAQYDYTLIQERLLNYVMFYLQGHIDRVMKGQHVQQLDIFREQGDEIMIVVPLGMIAQPAQYRAVRESAAKLASQVVSMKHKTNDGVQLKMFRGLFTGIGVPQDKKRSAEMYLFIHKSVAQWLMHIERNSAGEPYAYTSFYLEVANSAKNKYTSRIYKLLSSWKKKGATRAYTVQELKDMLQLGDKYDYDILRRRVLEPVKRELRAMYEAGDCDLFFEVTNMRTGKRVDTLSFKIVTVTGAQHQELLRKNVVKLLVEHFKFNDILLRKLDPIFHEGLDHMEVLNKILYLYDRYNADRTLVPHPQAWVISSLLKEFAK